jgi:hypothetical protein
MKASDKEVAPAGSPQSPGARTTGRVPYGLIECSAGSRSQSYENHDSQKDETA